MKVLNLSGMNVKNKLLKHKICKDIQLLYIKMQKYKSSSANITDMRLHSSVKFSMLNHFIIDCESFAINFSFVRSAVCVDFFMTYHQISSLVILGTKCTLKRHLIRVNKSSMKCH
jgi:hypothetical protein